VGGGWSGVDRIVIRSLGGRFPMAILGSVGEGSRRGDNSLGFATAVEEVVHSFENIGIRWGMPV